MIGIPDSIIESTAQLAPLYAGLVLCLLASAFGIACASPLRHVVGDYLERRRQRRALRLASKRRPPAVGHFPSQA